MGQLRSRLKYGFIFVVYFFALSFFVDPTSVSSYCFIQVDGGSWKILCCSLLSGGSWLRLRGSVVFSKPVILLRCWRLFP